MTGNAATPNLNVGELFKEFGWRYDEGVLHRARFPSAVVNSSAQWTKGRAKRVARKFCLGYM